MSETISYHEALADHWMTAITLEIPCEMSRTSQLSLAQIAYKHNCEQINDWCLNPLSYGVICYVALDNCHIIELTV